VQQGCGRAIELDGKLAAVWANRGAEYRKLGQYDKTIANCAKAIKLDEKCTVALARWP
jgi:tetratricopeptide (TPR) repeat protein